MIARIIRWITAHVRGLHAEIGTVLVLGLAVSLGALAAFAWIARAIAGDVPHGLDAAIVLWARSHAAPLWDALALFGAVVGSGAALWIVLGLGSAWFLFSRHVYSLALLWIALAGARVLNTTLKELFDRPRPGLAGDIDGLVILGRTFEYPTSYSFPSGHAVTAIVVFGTLAWLVIRLEPTVRMRRITIAAATLVIVLVGASRVYLGVHYPSDVLAGYLAGFIWATFAAFSIEVLRYALGQRAEAAQARRAARLERDAGKGMEPARDALRHEHP